MPRPLEDQVIVLTGASSGIGREVARLFGRRGASVVLAARDEEELVVRAKAGEAPSEIAYVRAKAEVAQVSRVDEDSQSHAPSASDYTSRLPPGRASSDTAGSARSGFGSSCGRRRGSPPTAVLRGLGR